MKKAEFIKLVPELNGVTLDRAAQLIGCNIPCLRVRFSSVVPGVVSIQDGIITVSKEIYNELYPDIESSGPSTNVPLVTREPTIIGVRNYHEFMGQHRPCLRTHRTRNPNT